MCYHEQPQNCSGFQSFFASMDPSYRITRSARLSTPGGIVMPISPAILRFTIILVPAIEQIGQRLQVLEQRL